MITFRCKQQRYSRYALIRDHVDRMIWGALSPEVPWWLMRDLGSYWRRLDKGYWGQLVTLVPQWRVFNKGMCLVQGEVSNTWCDSAHYILHPLNLGQWSDAGTWSKHSTWMYTSEISCTPTFVRFNASQQCPEARGDLVKKADTGSRLQGLTHVACGWGSWP